MCEVMGQLGVAIDGGKDSLSMAARVGKETVKAPGTVILCVCVCVFKYVFVCVLFKLGFLTVLLQVPWLSQHMQFVLTSQPL